MNSSFEMVFICKVNISSMEVEEKMDVPIKVNKS